MDRTLISLFVCISLLSQVKGEEAVQISVSPSAKVKVGETVTVTCILAEKWKTQTIVWTRKVGSMETTMLEGGLLTRPFSRSGRYEMMHVSNGWKLTISNAVFEDSATIGCEARGSGESASYQTIAVCDDVTLPWCNCAVEKGWASPECFEKPQGLSELEASCNRTATGLGVCLAIAIIYGVVASILVGWDCMARINQKRKKRAEQREAEARRRDPYSGDTVRLADPSELELDYGDGPGRSTPVEMAARPPASAPPAPGGRILGRQALAKKTKADEAASQGHPTPRSVSEGAHENDAYCDSDGDSGHPYTEIANVPPTYTNEDIPKSVARGGARQKQSSYQDQPPSYQNAYKAPEKLPATSVKSPTYQNGYGPKSPSYDSQAPHSSPAVAAGYPSGPDGYTGPSGHRPQRSNDSSGYDSYPPYIYSNPNENQSPAAWSTKSAEAPPVNSYYPDDNAPRNAYSERPAKDYHGGRAGYSEPRRLDFVNGQVGTGGAYNTGGAYIEDSSGLSV